jgi:hypothetical protein
LMVSFQAQCFQYWWNPFYFLFLFVLLVSQLRNHCQI